MLTLVYVVKMNKKYKTQFTLGTLYFYDEKYRTAIAKDFKDEEEFNAFLARAFKNPNIKPLRSVIIRNIVEVKTLEG